MVSSLLHRYRHLRRLTVGPSCNGLTDAAFNYLGDNDEGVQAGLKLESMYVCCSLHVTGKGWLLDVDSVRRNLPQLKSFKISASRHHCGCGRRGCGKNVKEIKKVQEACGIRFTDASPHW